MKKPMRALAVGVLAASTLLSAAGLQARRPASVRNAKPPAAFVSKKPSVEQLRANLSPNAADSLISKLRGTQVIIEAGTHNADRSRDAGTDLLIALKDSLRISATIEEELTACYQPELDSLLRAARQPGQKLGLSYDLSINTLLLNGTDQTHLSIIYRIEHCLRAGVRVVALGPQPKSQPKFSNLDQYINYLDSLAVQYVHAQRKTDSGQAVWVRIGAAHAGDLARRLRQEGIQTAVVEIWEPYQKPLTIHPRAGQMLAAYEERFNRCLQAYDSAFAGSLHQLEPRAATDFYLSGSSYLFPDNDLLVLTRRPFKSEASYAAQIGIQYRFTSP